MKKMGMAFLAMVAFAAFSHTAQASDYMTAEQAKSALTNKTFDGVYLPKNSKFKAFEDPNGDHIVLRPNGNRDKGRKWMVNDMGQHCTSNPKKKNAMRCTYLKDAGNGEIHKFDDNGKHTHTLSNFRDGNQL